MSGPQIDSWGTHFVLLVQWGAYKSKTGATCSNIIL